MTATFGEKIKMTIFGESHGLAIGCVIDGLPPGTVLDLEAVKAEIRDDRESEPYGQRELERQRKTGLRDICPEKIFPADHSGSKQEACPNDIQ